MSIRSRRDIYRVVEKYLRQSDRPLTCVDLMDHSEVEQEAFSEFGGDKQHAANKLSDTLGFMWRRGLLNRYPYSGDQMARYAYAWIETAKDTPPAEPVTTPRKAKTGVTVQEREDGIMIEFDKFFVFIRPK